MSYEVDEIVWRFTAKADASEVDELTEAEEKAGDAAEGLGGKLKTLALGVAAAATAAAAAAVVFGKDLVFSAAEAQDEIGKSARNYGIAAETLQEMRYSAEALGVPIELVTKAAADLEVKLGDAARTGAGPAADALADLGLEAKNLAGLSVDEKMGVIADHLNRVSNSSKRASISTALFGGAAKKMGNFLAVGSKGLEDLADEAHRFGRVMSDEAIAESEEFQQNLQQTRSIFKSFTSDLANKAMPQIREIIVRMGEWGVKNKDLISSGIESFLSGLVTVVEMTGKAVGFTVEHWEELLALLAGAKLATALSAASTGLTAVGAGATASLGPIGALAIALAALIPIAMKAGAAIGDALAKRNELRAEERGEGADVLLGDLTPSERAEVIAANKEIERAQRAIDESGGGVAEAVNERLRNDAAKRKREIESRVRDRKRREEKGRIAEENARRKDEAAREQVAAEQAAAEAEALATKSQLEAAKKLNRGPGKKKEEDEKTLDELIGEAAGTGLSALDGRGSAGGLGGVFVRIDASFSAPVTVTIEIPGGDLDNLKAPGQGKVLAGAINEALQPVLRSAEQHFQEKVRI